jgi:hypothetical protein
MSAEIDYVPTARRTRAQQRQLTRSAQAPVKATPGEPLLAPA